MIGAFVKVLGQSLFLRFYCYFCAFSHVGFSALRLLVLFLHGELLLIGVALGAVVQCKVGQDGNDSFFVFLLLRHIIQLPMGLLGSVEPTSIVCAVSLDWFLAIFVCVWQPCWVSCFLFSDLALNFGVFLGALF